jgi:MFS family permease
MNSGQMSSGQVHKCCSVKCISWSAILVGALVGVGLGFLLNLFSVAIGLSAFSTSPEGVSAFAIGGFIGLAIGGVVSQFVAGWTAGYLAHPHCPKRNSGALYGFTTWAVGLIFIIFLSSPVAHYLASSSSYISNHTVVMSHPDAPAAADTTVSTEKAANDTGKAGLALFTLFFLAALAGSYGGHFGMVCRPEDCSSDPARRM